MTVKVNRRKLDVVIDKLIALDSHVLRNKAA
jgi:hypothetical protein